VSVHAECQRLSNLPDALDLDGEANDGIVHACFTTVPLTESISTGKRSPAPIEGPVHYRFSMSKADRVSTPIEGLNVTTKKTRCAPVVTSHTPSRSPPIANTMRITGGYSGGAALVDDGASTASLSFGPS
jgi:hypothetical protein